MSATGLALQGVVAAAVVVAAAPFRPPPSRVIELVAGGQRRPDRPDRSDRSDRSGDGPRRGSAWPGTGGSLPADRSTLIQAMPWVVLVVLIAWWWGLGAVMVAGLTCVFAVAGRRRREGLERSRHQARVLAAMPETVDLVRLALEGGLVPAAAVQLCGAHSPAPIGPAFDDVAGSSVGRLADRLTELVADDGRLGDAARPLVSALVAAERHGAPVAVMLERTSIDVADQIRRSAEERARRLPVLMLFPLVGCILPAFILLATVPLVVAPLSRLTGSGF